MRASLRRPVAVLLVLACACSTVPTPPQARAPEHYPNAQARNGLAIAAQPMLDGGLSLNYFGADLPADIVPVYVVAENRHPSSSYVLSRQRIALIAGELQAASVRKETSPDGRDARRALSPPSDHPVRPPVIDPYTLAIVLAVAVVVIPVAIAVSDAQRRSEAVQYRLRAQEFQNRTLAPGESAAGFVFFQIPKGVRLPPKRILRIEASTAGHDDRMAFEFDVSR